MNYYEEAKYNQIKGVIDFDPKLMVGVVVKFIMISGEEQICRMFLSDDATVIDLIAQGDCCSQSWWAEIYGLHNLLGRRIESCHEIDWPEREDGRTRQDVDRWYGIEFKTMAGDCQFVYRNSSNGYYGGSCQIEIWDYKDRDAIAERDDKNLAWRHDDNYIPWRSITTNDWTAY